MKITTKKNVYVNHVVYVCLLIIFIAVLAQKSVAQDPVDLVNPLVGTTKAGNTFPAVGVPFGMTQWTPQTRLTKFSIPYHYYDPMIQGFRGSHWLSGSATQEYGSMTIMPTTGTVGAEPQARASAFHHDEEVAKPNYYRVKLRDYQIIAELTGTTRSGMMRFMFPKSDSSRIIIDSNTAYQATTGQTHGDGFIKIDPDKNEIIGYNPVYRKYQGRGSPAGIKGYFVIRFSKSINQYATWDDGQAPQVHQKQANDRPKAFVQFQTHKGEQIEVKIGTSFTSMQGARKNLDQEIPNWNFDAVRRSARQKWNDELSRLKVKGGSQEQQTSFYTSLYHALLLPRVFNDVDGAYVGFSDDQKTYHTKGGHQQYVDYSLWDTFRAVHPLFTIVEPDRTADMVQSLVNKGEQGGYLPIFAAWNNYTSEMIGDHAVTVIVDAYRKGIRDFDVQAAYKLIRKNAMTLPDDHQAYVDGKGRRALDAYKKFGYIPLETPVNEAYHHGEQVSRTLEYTYDDWVDAQLAETLGHEDDYDALMKRAHNYKNVFDPAVGFMRGRHRDGSWAADFDSTGDFHYITEGTPLQYTWFVPHDVQGLIDLMGGRSKFTARLQASFEQASKRYPSFRRNPYYWHGNEPAHHVPYLFDYSGAPWRTQYWVRQIINRSYQPSPGGLSGNDDAGQMSAWYIFSTMGFYPVCPGEPVYAIGSPVFDEITINVGDGKHFTVKTVHNSKKNKYIQSARLNGKNWDKPWISHQTIMNGGQLKLNMGPSPNKAWGSDPEAAPPSMTK